MLRPCSSEIDDGLSLARQYVGHVRDGRQPFIAAIDRRFVCIGCAKQADIGIIVDQSTSIVAPPSSGYDNWDVSIKGFLTQFIAAFRIGPQLTRIGVVGFSSSAWLEWGLSAYNDSQTLTQAVRAMDIMGGETYMSEVCPTSVIFGHLVT